MVWFEWICETCAAVFDDTEQLRQHIASSHHPLNGAIDYLMYRNGLDALAGVPDCAIAPRRRLLINLIGERAYDTGIIRREGHS